MNVFTRVAKAGSFAGGARELGISRAMVSKHVVQLENILSTRLFNRTTRSLSLTDAGMSYLERCQQVLSEIEEMEAAVTHMQTEPRGMLRINAPPVLGATHIAAALSEFLKLHPDLNVEMLLHGHVGDLGDLIDEGIDLAINLGELEDSSLVARKMASSPLVICASPGYLACHGEPAVPEDLRQHSCLINWAIPPRNQWKFSCDAGDQVIKVAGRFQANVAYPIRNAALNDLGLVMLPKYIIGRDIEKGKLTIVMQNFHLPPLEVHAVYPHRKFLSAKVRTFLEFLQPWLQKRFGMNSNLNP